MDICSLNFSLLWKISFFPSMVLKVLLGIVIIAGICGLLESEGHLSLQALLTFRVTIEKFGIILIYLPLHVTWSFPLQFLIVFPCSLYLMFVSIQALC